MVKSAQVWTGSFATQDSTGALLASTSAPTAVLYVNGVSNAAAVTVTGSNPYKWSVTLPTLTAGDTVEIYASATIATIPVSQYVASAIADTSRLSDVAAVVSHVDYGNAKLVRSTTPANTLDVSATGEAGLDFANVKQATGPTTLTNITVPVVTTLTNMPAAAPSAATIAAAILVTPAYKLATLWTGEVQANVSLWRESPPADLDDDGNVPTADPSGGTINSVLGTVKATDEDGAALATAAELAALAGGATLTVSSPVAENGDTELYAGDDYNNSDGRALEWSSSDWPDLTAATITLYLRAPDGSKFSKAGSAPVVGSGSQTARVELTAAETATLIDWPTPSTLRLRATLAVSGRKVTLVTGVLTVAEDIS